MSAAPETSFEADASRTPAALRGLRIPPGPRAPKLIQTLQVLRNSVKFHETAHARYGDTYSWHMVSRPLHVTFTHPDDVHELLVGRCGGPDHTVAPVLGWQNLLGLTGEPHLRARRIILPPLRANRMPLYGPLVDEICDQVLASWKPGTRFPIEREAARMTFEVILRAAFGADSGEELDRLRARVLEFLSVSSGPYAAALALIPLQIDLGPYSPWGRVRRARDAIDEEIFALIARRRSRGTADRIDVLSRLIEGRDDGGEAFSDQELRDHLMLMLMAGQDSSAKTVALAFNWALRDPRVMLELANERRKLGGGVLGAKHASDLDYHECVIRETLRMAPIPETNRRLLEVSEIAGWVLPKGTVAYASFYLMHRRPDFWEQPTEFRPERFLVHKNPPGYSPFGAGLRRCPGSALAMFEDKLILARILSRAHLRIAPGYRMRFQRRGVVIGPSEGTPVIYEGPR